MSLRLKMNLTMLMFEEEICRKDNRLRPPRPKRAPRPKREPGEEPTGEHSKNTLFVHDLPFSLDDAGLAALFTDAGYKVTSAHIVRRRWGHPRKSKGYGFVELESEDKQQEAMEKLQDKDVDGRAIKIKIAINQKNVEGEDVKEPATVE